MENLNFVSCCRTTLMPCEPQAILLGSVKFSKIKKKIKVFLFLLYSGVHDSSTYATASQLTHPWNKYRSVNSSWGLPVSAVEVVAACTMTDCLAWSLGILYRWIVQLLCSVRCCIVITPHIICSNNLLELIMTCFLIAHWDGEETVLVLTCNRSRDGVQIWEPTLQCTQT